MLLRIVSGNIYGNCEIYEILFDQCTFFKFVTSSLINISPSLCSLNPDNIEINEVLPLPLCPTRQIFSPLFIDKVILSRIFFSSLIKPIFFSLILSTLSIEVFSDLFFSLSIIILLISS